MLKSWHDGESYGLGDTRESRTAEDVAAHARGSSWGEGEPCRPHRRKPEATFALVALRIAEVLGLDKWRPFVLSNPNAPDLARYMRRSTKTEASVPALTALTEGGESNARLLGERLIALSFWEVFTSPLQRARRTCELAGFGDRAEIDRDLVEWNYGEYEGRRTEEIHKERPDWQLFRDGCPAGESPHQVGERANKVINVAHSA
jgi:hypothetical protein